MLEESASVRSGPRGASVTGSHLSNDIKDALAQIEKVPGNDEIMALGVKAAALEKTKRQSSCA